MPRFSLVPTYLPTSTETSACAVEPSTDHHCCKLSFWISSCDIRLPDVDLPCGIQHDHRPAALVVTAAFQSKRQSIIRSLCFAGTWLAARIRRLGAYSVNQPLGRNTQRAGRLRGHASSWHRWVFLRSYAKTASSDFRIFDRQILSEISVRLTIDELTLEQNLTIHSELIV